MDPAGTATCSAARARTSTRAHSRASGRAAGHDVTVLSQEPHPERYDLGGARVGTARRRRAAAGLRARPLRGLRGQARAGLLPGRARRLGRARTRPRCASCCRPTSSSAITCSSAGRWVPRPVRASRSRRTARSSSTRCAATRSSPAWGREALAGRRPSSSALPTSARCSRTSSVTSIACTRCRPASTSTSGGRGRATRRSPGCSRRRGATAPNPANAERAAARRGERRTPGRVPGRRPADGRLLREAPLQQGRPRPARGASRASTPAR